jgi:hypothetical protein
MYLLNVVIKTLPIDDPSVSSPDLLDGNLPID